MKKIYLLLALCTPLLSSAQWTPQNPNLPPLQMGFSVDAVNANVAWVLGMAGDFSQQSWNFTFEGHDFARTTDGGQTWTAGTFPTSGAGWVSNINAVNGNEAWISFVDFGSASHIFRTTNGGATWTDPASPIDVWVDYVYFWDSTNGVAMGDPDSLGFQIATSPSSGSSWVRLNPAAVPLNHPGEAGISGVFCTDGSNRIWFGTTEGRVYYSTTKGYSWQVSDPGANAWPDAITCSQDGHCLISYSSYGDSIDPNFSYRLFRSADYGVNWTEITPADNGFAVPSLQYIPGGNGAVIGTFRHNNNVGPYETRVSYDNGTSWQTIDSSTKLFKIDFASTTAGWATEYKNTTDPSHVYRYSGSPLLGLFAPNSLQADISLSPNPATDLLNVSVHDITPGAYWLLLNDLQGRLIRKMTVTAQGPEISEKIDLSGLPKGVYLLTVTGKNGSAARKVVKE